MASDLADLGYYGQMVLATPDFVERIKANAPIAEANRSTFSGGTEKGYPDYPALGSP
ncbi:MAG: hypothetical protein LBU76_03800 [Azoarcus sp.]|nr:hypothetical protein [Azoarcus sp.]